MGVRKGEGDLGKRGPERIPGRAGTIIPTHNRWMMVAIPAFGMSQALRLHVSGEEETGSRGVDLQPVNNH
jgi:hypothetical protein